MAVLCIDIGTTEFKAVIRQDGGLVMKKFNEGDPNELYEQLIDKYQPERVFITGSGERLLTEEKAYEKLNELEATAYIVRYMGLEEGLVTNIGTGTSFTLLSDGGYTHLNGTGVGGGAFIGLGERMLGVTEPEAIEALALGGELANINIIIDDIYPQGLGWMAGDVTVANFAKKDGDDRDVALGIHSLITESIVSMVRALLFHNPIKDIVVCGGVTNNLMVRKLFDKYSTLFGFKTRYLETPSFGTALGMLALVEDKFPDLVRE